MKRAVIFGSGKEGSILYYTLPAEYKIMYFIDNKVPSGSVDNCLDMDVHNPNYLLEDRSWDIVIISSMKYVGEMSRQLEVIGLNYGDDYVTSYDLDNKVSYIDTSLFVQSPPKLLLYLINKIIGQRKLVTVFGNCQTEVIVHLLACNRKVSEKILVLKIPPLFYDECIPVLKYLIKNGVWKKIDIFITHVVRQDNRFSQELSTEYLTSLLSDECEVIKIPNLFFQGYWPDAYDIPRKHRVLPKWYGQTGLIANGYNIIDSLVSSGLTVDDVIRAVAKEDLISESEITKNIENELQQYKKREVMQRYDITISDYLRANIRRELMFYSYRHPSMKLITELTQRLVNYIGINTKIYQDDNQNFHFMNYSMLLYPSVINALGLDKSLLNMPYYPYSGLTIGISFEQYIYLYINYQNKFKE